MSATDPLEAPAGPAEAERNLTAVRVAIYAIGLALGFFTVFVLWHAQAAVERNTDLYKFADLGRNLAEGNGFRVTGGPLTVRRGPGYPALIALLYTVFGAYPVVVQVAQCFVVGGTVLLAFEIGRLVFSHRVGLIAAAMVGLHPMVQRYVPDIQVEATMTFLYTLTAYRTVRLVQRATILNGLWVGLAAAGACMVKAVALPYAVFFAVAYLVWRYRSQTPRGPMLVGWKPIAAMAFGMAVVILPWTYRNYGVTGKFVLVSGNASGEFLRGYVFAQDRYYLLRDKPYEVGENEANAMQEALFAKQGLVWQKDEAETERVQNVAAKAKMRSDPMAFVRKFAIGLLMFWYVVTTRMNSLLVLTLAIGGWALAFLGWSRDRTGRHPFLFFLLVLPIVSLNVMYAAVLALGRYSAPCIPLLMVLAAHGVDTFLRRRPAIAELASEAPAPMAI